MEQEQSGVNGQPSKRHGRAKKSAKTLEHPPISAGASREVGGDGVVISEFSFQDTLVQTFTQNGEIWLRAPEVCREMGMRNSRQALSRLDPDEKGVMIVDTPGGPQSVNLINESGLYSLAMTSRKPEALAFRKWVMREVLPTIRKTGFYVQPGRPDAIVIPTPDELTRYVVLAGRGLEPSIRRTDPMDTIAEYGALDLDALCVALKSIDVWWKKTQIGLSLHAEATKGFAIAQLDESVRNGIKIVDQYFGRQDGA